MTDPRGYYVWITRPDGVTILRFARTPEAADKLWEQMEREGDDVAVMEVA